MARKSAGAILCPRCGRLTHPDADECLVCGLRRPGRWQWAGRLGRLWRSGRFTGLVTVACVALYALSVLADPSSALRVRGPFDLLSPSMRALDALGMTGAYAWSQGRWWTVFTAIYLHGNLLHILFNVLWIRQLGPEVEALYGPARLVIIFTTSGAFGFLLSNVVAVVFSAGLGVEGLFGFILSKFIGAGFTVGASGAIFGLFGAMVAYGRRRGGRFGALVLRQYGQWALVLFVLGFFMAGVNNVAHAGGFLGGFLAGLVLSFSDRREESVREQAIAFALIAITALSFGLALWTAVIG